MVRLSGYDGRFGLRCWWGAGRDAPPQEVCSDDLETLRTEAARLVAAGAYRLVELSAWNFELNDWVRMEIFDGREQVA